MIKHATSSARGVVVSADAGGGSPPAWVSDTVTCIVKGTFVQGSNPDASIVFAFFGHELRFQAGRIDLLNPDGAVVRLDSGAVAPYFPGLGTALTNNEHFVFAVEINTSGGPGNHTIGLRLLSTSGPVVLASSVNALGQDGVSTAQLELAIGNGTKHTNNYFSSPDAEISGMVVYRGTISDAELEEVFADRGTDWWINGVFEVDGINDRGNNIVGLFGVVTKSGFDDAIEVGDQVVLWLEGLTSPDRTTSPSLIDDTVAVIDSGRGNNAASFIDPRASVIPEVIPDFLLTLDPGDQPNYFTSRSGQCDVYHRWLGGGGGVTADDRIMLLGNSRGAGAGADESASSIGARLSRSYAGGATAYEIARGTPPGGIGVTDPREFGQGTAPEWGFAGVASADTTASTASSARAKFATGAKNVNRVGAPMLIRSGEFFAAYADRRDFDSRLVLRQVLLCIPGESNLVDASVRRSAFADGASSSPAAVTAPVTVTYVMQSGGVDPVTATGGAPVVAGDVVLGIPLDTTLATLSGPTANDDNVKTIMLAPGLTGDSQPQPGMVLTLGDGANAGRTNEVVSYDGATGQTVLRHHWANNGYTGSSITPLDVTDTMTVYLGWYGYCIIEAEVDLTDSADDYYAIHLANVDSANAAIVYLEARDPSRAAPTFVPGGSGGNGLTRQNDSSHSDKWGLLLKAIGVTCLDIHVANQGDTADTITDALNHTIDSFLEYNPGGSVALGDEPSSNASSTTNTNNNNQFIDSRDRLDYDGATDPVGVTSSWWAHMTTVAADRGVVFASGQLGLGSWPSQLSRGVRSDGSHLSVLGNEQYWAARRALLATAAQAAAPSAPPAISSLDPFDPADGSYGVRVGVTVDGTVAAATVPKSSVPTTYAGLAALGNVVTAAASGGSASVTGLQAAAEASFRDLVVAVAVTATGQSSSVRTASLTGGAGSRPRLDRIGRP
ncbi:MAG: hypothetical protein AAGI53_01590 [Planctomycetota bacterium]